MMIDYQIGSQCSYFAKKYCEKHPEFESQKRHHAIIVAISTKKFWHRLCKNYPYSGGTVELINHLLEKKLPYKVYECRTIDAFDAIIRNDNAAILWIFGHGSKGGLLILNEKVDYAKYDTSEYASHKKKEIYQLHCNKGGEKSLTKILASGNGIDTGYRNGKRTAYNNEAAIQKLFETEFSKL